MAHISNYPERCRGKLSTTENKGKKKLLLNLKLEGQAGYCNLMSLVARANAILYLLFPKETFTTGSETS